MSNVMLQTLLNQANEAIENNLKKARSESWKDNAFEKSPVYEQSHKNKETVASV